MPPVVDGPAPRNLPALPLKIMDGTLVVAKPYGSGRFRGAIMVFSLTEET